jgi:hypothetical protein
MTTRRELRAREAARAAEAQDAAARETAPPPVQRTRRLDRSVPRSHHLLVLREPTSLSELAAVVVQRAPDARTRRDDEILLGPGAVLTGPWEVTAELAAELDVPGSCAFVLRVRPDRGDPVPTELRGTNPLDDAFPEGTPLGDELQALEDIQAVAKRLGGAVRVTGTGAVLVPDPASMVDRLVRSEVELSATELAVVLDRWLDQVDVLADDVWGGGSSAVGGRFGDGPEWARDMVTIEVSTAPPAVDHRQGLPGHVTGVAPAPAAAAPAPPSRPEATGRAAAGPRSGSDPRFVVPPLEAPVLGGGRADGPGLGQAGSAWTTSSTHSVSGHPVLTYEVRFRPGRPMDVLGFNPSRAARRSRREAQRMVDGVTADLVRLIGGQVVDDDGFHRVVEQP